MDNKTALDIVRCRYDENLYKVIEEAVDDGHVKHDVTACYDIAHDLTDDTYWRIGYHTSYECGLYEYSISTRQVEKTEVVKTVWVPV